MVHFGSSPASERSLRFSAYELTVTGPKLLFLNTCFKEFDKIYSFVCVRVLSCRRNTNVRSREQVLKS